jgi:LysR family glycine cleavage system transcriptional activator
LSALRTQTAPFRFDGHGQACVHSVCKSLVDINLLTTSLYPEINIRFISVIWANLVLEDNVDVDLRIGYGDWPGLQVEKITQETTVPICAKVKSPFFNHLTDLLDSPLVLILGHEDSGSRFVSANGFSMDSEQMKYSVDTTIASLALVSAGVGPATILTRFAKTAIGSGSKIGRVAEPIEFPQSHYLIYSPANNGPQRPEVEIFTT